MTITLEIPKKFRVTVESYDGGCKRVTVLAHSPEDAMARAQRGGWYPVEVKEIV